MQAAANADLFETAKKTVDDWLNEVNYKSLNTGHYVPSTFAINFANMIKLINGAEGEDHKTPVVHFKMLDKIAGDSPKIANLCSRGLAKTTLMFEYLIFYVAIFQEIEGFGKLDSMIYVSDSMENGVKSARKNIEHRYERSDWLKEWLPQAKFTDNYIEFLNRDGKKFGVKMFGAKTGIRGTKIFGKRPKLAVLDDLVSDDDAKSKTSMEAINDTVYKGIDYALDPTRNKVIFNGTPFAKTDILYEAVESGAWDVNVWPVCEHFPCSREEFQGAWEERFSYDYVRAQYELSKKTGKLAAFNQELMLRITTPEERLIADHEIRWYDRALLLQRRSQYNFYITTDFATSEKQKADFSVISVWAYNAHGQWFWVDGICKRQTMDKSVDDLFRLAQAYNPQSVGIEVSGQQNAFISWLQREQMDRNIWFNFAKQNGKPGIRPVLDKLSRFNLAVPLFTNAQVFFPEEMRNTAIIEEFVSEIALATINGIKGKDDCLDTISMLVEINAWRPSQNGLSEATAENTDEDGVSIWGEDAEEEETGDGLSSYVV